jgi:transketolase
MLLVVSRKLDVPLIIDVEIPEVATQDVNPILLHLIKQALHLLRNLLRVEVKALIHHIADWTKLIPKLEDFPTEDTPSRKAAGQVINPIAQNINSLMVGTGDLTPSVNMAWKGKVDFQNPDLRTACGINGDYSGRYIHWGIREHAMASASNGMAAFNKGTILPIT